MVKMCGSGGQVISMLALYSDNKCSIPTKPMFEKNGNKQKEPWVGPCLKKCPFKSNVAR